MKEFFNRDNQGRYISDDSEDETVRSISSVSVIGTSQSKNEYASSVENWSTNENDYEDAHPFTHDSATEYTGSDPWDSRRASPQRERWSDCDIDQGDETLKKQPNSKYIFQEPLADLGGGARDARPPLGPKISLFSCSFREKLAK